MCPQQVDPIKLNQTLSATAEALDGLGDRFGQSIVHGNEILADINPQMPQIRRLNQGLANLGDVYANAAPDLFDGLEHAVTTARTLNEQQGNIDQALMAAVGFGNTGGDIFERGGPYLVRGTEDLIPTSQLLDTYSPALFCTIRNFHDVRAQGRRIAWRQRVFAAHPLGDLGIGSRQPVRVSRQPAAGERAGRPRGQAGLLAAHHA